MNAVEPAAAIYIRVASDDGPSGASAESCCRDSAAMQGRTSTRVYTDLPHGHRDADPRPGLTALVEDAELGVFDTVVVATLEDFSRDFFCMARTVTKLKALGIDVYSVADRAWITPGRLATLEFDTIILADRWIARWKRTRH